MYTRSSIPDIAKSYGVSVTATRKYAADLGLHRTLSEANRLRYRFNVTLLNQDQEQVVYGSLLGDACLYRQYRPTFSTLKVGFAHGQDQRQYLEYKKSVMGGSRISTRPVGSNVGKPVSQFSYSNTQGLLPVERVVMLNGKKTVSAEWLSKLNWHGISIWYQDDASLILNKKRSKPSCIRFYTNSFSKPEIDLLCDFLRSKGLQSLSIATGNSNPDQRVIVAFRALQISDFVGQLKPYACQCLNYKFQV